MGNLFTFTKKNRDYDSVILDELNRPLIPNIQLEIFTRLNKLEQDSSDLKTTQTEIYDRLNIVNDTVSHKNVTIGNDIYKINEALHKVDVAIRDILADLERLVKNDQILKKEIDIINKQTTIHGLYTSETSFANQTYDDNEN